MISILKSKLWLKGLFLFPLLFAVWSIWLVISTVGLQERVSAVVGLEQSLARLEQLIHEMDLHFSIDSWVPSRGVREDRWDSISSSFHEQALKFDADSPLVLEIRPNLIAINSLVAQMDSMHNASLALEFGSLEREGKGTELHRRTAQAIGEVESAQGKLNSYLVTLSSSISRNWWHLYILAVASCLLALVASRLLMKNLQNLAKRQRAEASLKESEERYKQIVDQAGDIIYKTDLEGRFTFFNPTTTRILKYTEQELTGLNYLKLIPPGYRGVVRRFYGEQFVKSNANTYYEFPAVTKDGREVWLGQNVQLIKKNEQPFEFQAVARDITERKLAEEAARKAEEYRNLFKLANDAILIIAPEGEVVLDVNDKACEIYGLERSDFIGRSLREMSQDPESYEPVLEGILEGAERRFETVHRSHDGTPIHFHVNASVIEYQGHRAVLLINRDITDRKQAEEALRRSEEQLRQAQKMESIGTLAGGVAHDFNNILAAILLNAQLAMKNPKAEPVKRRLEEIEKAGNRATVLTRQLLAFSRRQRLERKVIDLNETISDLLKMLQRIIGEDVEARFQPDTGLHQVFADPTQIEQIVMNLAVNARDAMPGGGTLLIETHNVEIDDIYRRRHLYAKPGSYAQIVVSDTGEGMAPGVRERIFEPFFTTKEVGKGTGLGLSMVYGIVKQHEGLIEVYSEPGRGTTFKIYLPINEKAIEENEKKEVPVAVRGGNETILLAEDEELLRNLARDVLEQMGYRILLAKDGVEAVETYVANEQQIDIVMLDLIMPRMGGYQACESIRSTNKNVPVIFMTGYSTEMAQTNFVKQGQMDEESDAVIIQKPYSIETLGHKLREVLDSAYQKQ